MDSDVHLFDRFARVYELCMPSARRSKLVTGLTFAEREIERVVDVAGGTGRGVQAVDAPERIVVDAATGMVRRARRNGLVAIQGDAARLPLRSQSTDAVLIVDALHHVGDRKRAVTDAARVLRPGGVLVVADFDPTTVRGRALVAAEHAVGFDSAFDSPEALATRMKRAGLDPSVVVGGFGYVVAGVARERESQVSPGDSQ